MSPQDFPQQALLPPQQSVAGLMAAPSGAPMPERVVLLKALKRLVELEPENEGFITEHLAEIAGLVPEISRIDQVSFMVEYDNAGVIVAPGQPATARLNPDYQSELFAIIGYMGISGAGLALTDMILPTLIDFNIREQGRNFDLWTTNTPMAPYVNMGQSAGPIEYPRGAYVFRPGADVQVRFNVPGVAAYNAAATLGVRWGITLLTNMVRK